MRTYSLIIASILMIGLLTSCDNSTVDPEGTLNLSLESRVGDAPFVKNQKYTNAAGFEYSLEGFRFYISDISLMKEDGGEELVEGTWYFDAGGDWDNSDINFPTGRYNGMKFFIGVPEDQNLGNPAVYESGDALSIRRGMHWAWSTGYIFIKADGLIDSVGKQIGLIYHTGGNDAYKQMTLNSEAFEITEGQKVDFVMDLDIAKVFEGEGENVNMVEENFTHSVPGDDRQQAISKKVRDRFMEYALTKKPF
ncbi:MAG: MbnP family protein [Bacteroidota bacterium]